MSIVCKCTNINGFFGVDFRLFSLFFVLRLLVSCPSGLAAVVANVFDPCKRLACFKIVRVNVMRVCFALERDIAICCACVAVFKQQAKPPAKIKRPLKEEKALDLLPKMDRLMLPQSC